MNFLAHLDNKLRYLLVRERDNKLMAMFLAEADCKAFMKQLREKTGLTYYIIKDDSVSGL